MMWKRIGSGPIGTIGFGRNSVISLRPRAEPAAEDENRNFREIQCDPHRICATVLCSRYSPLRRVAFVINPPLPQARCQSAAAAFGFPYLTTCARSLTVNQSDHGEGGYRRVHGRRAHRRRWASFIRLRAAAENFLRLPVVATGEATESVDSPESMALSSEICWSIRVFCDSKPSMAAVMISFVSLVGIGVSSE